MSITDLRDQVALVRSHELEPIDVRDTEVDLPGRGLELRRRAGRKRRRDGRQVLCRRLAKIPIGRGLALKLGQLVGARVRVLEREQSDSAGKQKQRREESERHRELRADGNGKTRNEAREAIYAFSSFCIWRKKAKSVPSLMICSGVFVSSFASASCSAKYRSESAGS